MFQQRGMEKHYTAVVHGHFLETPQPLIIEEAIDGRPARSRIRLIEYDRAGDRSTLDVEIETGRKHQIRRHLAALGHPIVGDRRYGLGEEEQDLQLTATSLAFPCPLTGVQRRYRLA